MEIIDNDISKDQDKESVIILDMEDKCSEKEPCNCNSASSKELNIIINDINVFLEITEKAFVADYLKILKETNMLVKKLSDDILYFKSELDKERQKSKELDSALWIYKKNTCSINRNEFGHYFTSALNREHTEKDWLKFINTFDFSKLNRDIYNWIDNNC